MEPTTTTPCCFYWAVLEPVWLPLCESIKFYIYIYISHLPISGNVGNQDTVASLPIKKHTQKNNLSRAPQHLISGSKPCYYNTQINATSIHCGLVPSTSVPRLTQQAGHVHKSQNQNIDMHPSQVRLLHHSATFKHVNKLSALLHLCQPSSIANVFIFPVIHFEVFQAWCALELAQQNCKFEKALK